MRRVKRASRCSRRVPPPQDSDFDHEIGLVDGVGGDDDSGGGNGEAQASGPAAHVEQQPALTTPPPVAKTAKADHEASGDRKKTPESAIDVLYENQRGLFLCGRPRFAAKALGNLDPAPWTNAAHKASPTDIGTAQVPDPSWVWAWPEWKIYHAPGDGGDGDGWKYSFMFFKKFSWHGPAWWNSFVRRRAWIRKRVKRVEPPDGVDVGGYDYYLGRHDFSTRAPSNLGSEPSRSRTRLSHRGSRVSLAPSQPNRAWEDEGCEVAETVAETVEELLSKLRASVIDREKVELVESYLNRAGDELAGLQHHMHTIMSLFVFQASRRVLLSRLIEVHEQARRCQDKEDGSGGLSARRVASLEAAVKHADEEVRRLEYWSDMKGMVEENDLHI